MTTPNERPDLPPTQPEVSRAAPAPRLDFEVRAEALGHRAEALGHEAEAAVERLGQNPAVRETFDFAGRLWGVVLLAFGLWFFADVTLRMDLPAVAWDDLWPVVLILLGGLVVVRGFARRH
jgi:hypothetical protein